MNQTSAPVATKSRAKFLYWVFALTLAGILLYYSLRGIDWHQVWLTLETTRLSYLALMLIRSTEIAGPARFALACTVTIRRTGKYWHGILGVVCGLFREQLSAGQGG